MLLNNWLIDLARNENDLMTHQYILQPVNERKNIGRNPDNESLNSELLKERYTKKDWYLLKGWHEKV